MTAITSPTALRRLDPVTHTLSISTGSRPASPDVERLIQDAGTPRRRSMAASRSTMWEEDGDNDQYDDVKSASTSKLPSPFLDDHEPLTVSKSRVPPWLWAYIPFLVWIIVSILTGLAVALFHTEVFGALETFSHHMKESGLTGYAIFFAAIAFTCIPPMPFYGTLIILSGYTYGILYGFLVSYCAALSGAVAVYLASHYYLRQRMIKMLRCSPGMRKVVNAISHRPRLLFVIRLAPYPYNMLNAGCAAAEQLSFATYFWCTALALPKLLVHTSIGASIRSWVRYNDAKVAGGDEAAIDEQGQRLKAIFGGIGIGLCVVVFVWLFFVARRAVDEADDEGTPAIPEATPGLKLATSSAPLLSVQVDRGIK